MTQLHFQLLKYGADISRGTQSLKQASTDPDRKKRGKKMLSGRGEKRGICLVATNDYNPHM